MILPREDLVWVRADGEANLPFDPQKLAASICAAVPPAHSEDAQTVAESIVVAIHQYACEHAADRQVTAEEIGDMVEALLEMLGLEQWCLAYAIQRRESQIHLDEMVPANGAVCELSFYQAIDAALQRAARTGMRRLQMTGLRASVLRLRGTARWTTGCKRLADEIVRYVWARVEQSPARGGHVLQLAVVD